MFCIYILQKTFNKKQLKNKFYMSILKILCQQPTALYHTSVSYIDYIVCIANI